jgi:ribonuclease HI
MTLIEIYTDGACSKNPGPGGFAGVILAKENEIINNRSNFIIKYRKEISGACEKTTNNRMELTAVIKSLEVVEKEIKNNNINRIILYSDSKYIVDTIHYGWLTKWVDNNWKKSNNREVLNVDLWKRVLELIRNYQIKFVWVKGHDNNSENERCDYLAKSAIKNLNIKH